MLDELRGLFLTALKFDGNDAMPLVIKWNEAVKRVQAVFDNMTDKTADAVQVVRCSECKHWSRICDEPYLGEPGLGKCRNERFFAFAYGFETEDNFTCGDGERKGGGE